MMMMVIMMGPRFRGHRRSINIVTISISVVIVIITAVIIILMISISLHSSYMTQCPRPLVILKHVPAYGDEDAACVARSTMTPINMYSHGDEGAASGARPTMVMVMVCNVYVCRCMHPAILKMGACMHVGVYFV